MRRVGIAIASCTLLTLFVIPALYLRLVVGADPDRLTTMRSGDPQEVNHVAP